MRLPKPQILDFKPECKEDLPLILKVAYGITSDRVAFKVLGATLFISGLALGYFLGRAV
jgi:hypothetical protein